MNPVQKGEEAKRLLDDPLVKEAFEDIEKTITSVWQSTPDAELRNDLWYTLQGLNRFKNYFEAVIQNGQFELQLIEEKLNN